MSSFSRASQKAPPFDVLAFLGGEKIEAPENLITDDDIPFYQLRRLLFIHSKGNCLVRNHWKNAFIETTSHCVIPFSSIKGCVSSKSDITDFEIMPFDARSSANVQFHIETYRNRVEELADRVLNGTGDCAVYKGQPANIMQQGWDGSMWIANDGGSHRSAAVWHLDREQGRERLLSAKVTTHSIHPHFRTQCAEHSIWLFKFEERESLYRIRSELKESGIYLSEQDPVMGFRGSPDMCLIVKTSHPRHEAIAEAMVPAFNLSQWVRSLPDSDLQPAITSHLTL